MATTVITIQTNANGTGLILNDGHSSGPNITTFANPGDIIRWELIPNSGIQALTGIQELNTDIFNPNPAIQPNGSWQGTVGNFTSGTAENYRILYTINGNDYTYDPVIQLH